MGPVRHAPEVLTMRSDMIMDNRMFMIGTSAL